MTEKINIQNTSEAVPKNGELNEPGVREVRLGDDKEFASHYELPPLSTEAFRSVYGVAQLPVYAEFAYEGEGGDKWVLAQANAGEARPVDTDFVLAQVLPDGEGFTVLRTERLEDLYRTGKLSTSFNVKNRLGTDSTLYVERGGQGDNYVWRMSVGGEPIEMKVSDAVETIRKPRTKHESERRREFRQRWYKRIGAIGLAHAVLTSGGVADRLFDQFDDAGGRVHQVAETLESPLYQSTDMLDGIMMQDYPAGTLQEFNQEVIDHNESIEAAAGRVAQTMEDLDAHRYDSIRERAETYRVAHADQLLSPDQREDLLQRLETAQSNDDVMAVLRDFAAFYGLDSNFHTEASGSVADFDTTTSVGDTAYTVRAIIDSLGVIPKNILTSSDLRAIELGSLQTSGLGVTLGAYDPADGTLSIAVRPGSGRVMQRAEDWWQSIDTGQSATIVHEWEHGRQIHGYGGGEGMNEAKLAFDMVVHALRARLINNTDAITPYGSTEEKEFGAENVSGVVSERTDGLAHPDVARYYHSNANKAMLKELIALDAADAYFADYVVAENSRLMDRGVWAVAR